MNRAKSLLSQLASLEEAIAGAQAGLDAALREEADAARELDALRSRVGPAEERRDALGREAAVAAAEAAGAGAVPVPRKTPAAAAASDGGHSARLDALSRRMSGALSALAAAAPAGPVAAARTLAALSGRRRRAEADAARLAVDGELAREELAAAAAAAERARAERLRLRRAADVALAEADALESARADTADELRALEAQCARAEARLG